jgi:predicted dehydrogenase
MVGVRDRRVGVGVVGAGYWGPKHVRNLVALGARVEWIADRDPARLAAVTREYPQVRATCDYRDLLSDQNVDAIVVATPVSSHATLATQALIAGKHVLVEKPVARSSAEAEQLIGLAAARRLVLMVGHTFLFNPAVRYLKELIGNGELGDIYYAYAQRLNLGLFQADVNVIWDLAPHDISILMYVLDLPPTAASATGRGYVRRSIEDVAIVNLRFGDSVSASLHVSWLDPNKVRRVTVVGSQKMVTYDDVEALEKIRIYDKGVEPPPVSSFGEFQLSYRYGGISVPHLPTVEPLRAECEHFLDCVVTGRQPLTDGYQGLRVVRVLEAADASLRNGGGAYPIEDSSGMLESTLSQNGNAAQNDGDERRRSTCLQART